jgi:hypothetical protein
MVLRIDAVSDHVFGLLCSSIIEACIHAPVQDSVIKIGSGGGSKPLAVHVFSSQMGSWKLEGGKHQGLR